MISMPTNQSVSVSFVRGSIGLAGGVMLYQPVWEVENQWGGRDSTSTRNLRRRQRRVPPAPNSVVARGFSIYVIAKYFANDFTTGMVRHVR